MSEIGNVLVCYSSKSASSLLQLVRWKAKEDIFLIDVGAMLG